MSTLASSHLTMLCGYKLLCHPSKQCVIYTFNQYLVNSGGQSAIKKTTTLHLLFFISNCEHADEFLSCKICYISYYHSKTSINVYIFINSVVSSNHCYMCTTSFPPSTGLQAIPQVSIHFCQLVNWIPWMKAKKSCKVN
jgi:hypothetical protein